MDKYANILGFKVFRGSFNEALDEIDKYEKVNIISGNPEVLYAGFNDEILSKEFSSNRAFIIPDGVGTILASKMIKCPVKEKIAGIEFMQAVLEKSARLQKPVYLLGASRDVVQCCVEKIKHQHPGILVAGYRDGYFSDKDEEEIVEEIIRCKPYAVFVALGCPKQEMFIKKYMDVIPANVFMGVGGSFDGISGKVKRAPKFMINMGMEWLYRTIVDPKRIGRLSSIPKFLYLVKRYK